MIPTDSWTGDKLIKNYHTSRDGGKSWDDEESEVYFTTNFFLSPLINYHTRTNYNIVDLLSDFGGLQPIIIFFF